MKWNDLLTTDVNVPQLDGVPCKKCGKIPELKTVMKKGKNILIEAHELIVMRLRARKVLV